MQGLIRHILRTAITTLAIGSVTSSCVYDDGPSEEPEAPTETRSLLSLGFSMPMSRAEAGESNGYIAGTDYENYLDIANDGYRIYFFDKDNKYITRFIPLGVIPKDNDKINYDVLGTVPDDIIGLSDFKIVVLANWPGGYPDDKLVANTTTINDLCGVVMAPYNQYDCLSSFELNPDKGLTIPFFGLHHYTGVTIEKGKRTTLIEPVALLRAMAKIEVVVDTKGVSLTDIGLRGYNARGYCAPAGVYEQSDYDHGGVWDSDYVKTPHLIGDANDASPETSFIPMLRKYQEDDTHKETWIAYVPEYRNLAASDGTPNYKSHIEFKLDIQPDKTTPYSVYFCDYDANGKVIDGTDFDILRNNYYRFTITIINGSLVIKVMKWENAYDNKFTFN